MKDVRTHSPANATCFYKFDLELALKRLAAKRECQGVEDDRK